MKIRYGVGLAIMLGAVGAAGVALASQSVVDQRVAGMKSLTGAIRGATSAGDAAGARESLGTAIAYARSIQDRFPKGTGIGDPGIGRTRAMQDIWSKPAAFKAEATGFVAALEAASAAAGDPAAFDTAMGTVKKSCSSCHDAFRGPAIE